MIDDKIHSIQKRAAAGIVERAKSNNIADRYGSRGKCGFLHSAHRQRSNAFRRQGRCHRKLTALFRLLFWFATLFQIEDLWLRGQYDPEANIPAGTGFGPACLSVTNSQVSERELRADQWLFIWAMKTLL